MSDDDKMKTQLDKIAKMLNKAERTDNPAEAEAFTEMATKLIAKYGIEAALLDAHRNATDPTHKPQTVIHRRYVEFNPYSYEKATLVYRIFDPMRCQCVMSKKTGETVIHVFGFESDIRRAQMLYISLDVQVEQALAQAQPHRPEFEPLATWIKSFRNGFANAVSRRIEAAELDAATSSGSSTELVIVDRNKQVESAANSEFPDIVKKKQSLGSRSGIVAGFRAGERANLSGPAVGGNRRSLGN